MDTLIVKTGALGDVVRTTGLLPAIRGKFTHASIDWLVASNAAPILLDDPFIRTIFIDRLPSDASGRPRHYDWVICLEEDRGCLEALQGLSFERWSGCQIAADAITYTSDTADWFGMGLLRSAREGGLGRANELKKANDRSYLDVLCRGMGLDPERAHARVTFSSTWVHELEDRYGMLFGRERRRVVGLNPGAGGRWPTKSFSRPMTRELISQVRRHLDADVALLGGAAEWSENVEIARDFPAGHVVALDTTRDLRLLMAAVALCDVVVTTDSLALHLAIAVGTPALALFGPTSGAEIDGQCEIDGQRRLVVVETTRACGRCYLSRCPHSLSCMHDLPIDHIIAELQQLLLRPAPLRTHSRTTPT